MVIGGGDFQVGAGSCVLGLSGHPAALDALFAASWADDVGVVVVVGELADFLEGRKMRIESPTTTAATIATMTTRRSVWRRLRVFCSAASRACRAAF